MPAVDPVVERITQHVEESLRAVRRNAGYSVDLDVVRRGRRGNAVVPGQCVIFQFGRSAVPEASQDQSGWDQNYGLEIGVDAAEDLELDVDAAISRVAADVEKALVGTDALRHRGGLAWDTRIVAVQPFLDGAHGVQVLFVVRYFTGFCDPFDPAHTTY